MGPPRAPLPQAAAAAAIALARMVPKLGRAVFPPALFSPLVLSLFTRPHFLLLPCGIPPAPRKKVCSTRCVRLSATQSLARSPAMCRRHRIAVAADTLHITTSHSGTFSRTEGVLEGGEGRARRRRRRTDSLASRKGRGERARRPGKEGRRAAALSPLSLPRLGLG